MRALTAEQYPLTRPRLSSLLGFGCLLLAASMPLFVIGIAWFSPQTFLQPLNLAVTLTAGSLSAYQRAVLLVLAMVPALFESYGLLCARRCFQSFARQEYFNLAVVRGLRGFAAGMFLAVIAGLLAHPLTSLLMTLFAPAGKHTVTFGVDSGQLLRLLFAGILWQIAAVVSKAISLARENSQFV
jgi:hypothetical protein